MLEPLATRQPIAGGQPLFRLNQQPVHALQFVARRQRGRREPLAAPVGLLEGLAGLAQLREGGTHGPEIEPRLGARLRQVFQFVDIPLECLGRVGELERQHGRIGQSQQQRAGQLRQRASVLELAIRKHRVPAHRVVRRVVDASAAFPAEAHVERRHGEVLQERCEVRARSQRLEPQVLVALADGTLRIRCALHLAPPRFLGHRPPRARVHHLARHLAHHLLQGVRPAHVQPALPGAVRVDVDRRVCLQLGGMLLGPLRRTEQSPFLAVPQRQDDGAPGTPARLEQLAQRTAGLHERHRTADGVIGAVDPGVVMVAVDHPLVGQLAPGDADDHVVQGPRLPVEAQCHAGRRRTGAGVIGHRQRPAPLGRHHRSLHRPQQRQGIAIRNGQHGNLEDGGGLLAGQLARPGLGRPSRRQRVTGVHRHVHHAAALHALVGTERAVRIHIALKEPIVPGIGIDEAGDGAAFVGDLGLDAAPAAAVARQHDLALHADAHLLEPIEVGRHPVVDVDHFSGDVAVTRVRVEHRRHVGVGGIGIGSQHRLGDGHGVPRGRHHLDRAFGGPRHQGLEALDSGIEPE